MANGAPQHLLVTSTFPVGGLLDSRFLQWLTRHVTPPLVIDDTLMGGSVSGRIIGYEVVSFVCFLEQAVDLPVQVADLLQIAVCLSEQILERIEGSTTSSASGAPHIMVRSGVCVAAFLNGILVNTSYHRFLSGLIVPAQASLG